MDESKKPYFTDILGKVADTTTGSIPLISTNRNLGSIRLPRLFYFSLGKSWSNLNFKSMILAALSLSPSMIWPYVPKVSIETE